VIRYSLSLFVLVLLALAAQQFIPALTGLYNARLLLVTLVFLCASVTVGPPVMLALAFVCGFLWDAQCALGPTGGDPEIYKYPVESLRFGYSILLYGVIGYLMQGIQPLFREGKWQFSTALVGISIFVYLAAEYLIINFVRGGFVFTEATLYQIAATSTLTMLFSPLVFWVLFSIAARFGHEIRFEGLKKKQRARRRSIA
jgi:cell shape-determining protein MreD